MTFVTMYYTRIYTCMYTLIYTHVCTHAYTHVYTHYRKITSHSVYSLIFNISSKSHKFAIVGGASEIYGHFIGIVEEWVARILFGATYIISPLLLLKPYDDLYVAMFIWRLNGVWSSRNYLHGYVCSTS